MPSIPRTTKKNIPLVTFAPLPKIKIVHWSNDGSFATANFSPREKPFRASLHKTREL